MGASPTRAGSAAYDLNDQLEHNGSAVFACPPGTRPGQWWGHDLFA